jgi:hypothetical protein
MLGFLLQSSWALSLVKPHLDGLDGVFPSLERSGTRMNVAKCQMDVMRIFVLGYGNYLSNCTFLPTNFVSIR